jgi:hypothetical protein
MHVLVYLEIVLILMQDRCTVCAECSIDSEIIFHTPDGTPRWLIWNLVLIRLEMLLVLVQDCCTVCAEHTIASDIIFNAANGTPKRRGSSRSSFRYI